jgi:hypothetical protein
MNEVIATPAQARDETSVRMGQNEEDVPVSTFVSMVRRTKRTATKLEN